MHAAVHVHDRLEAGRRLGGGSHLGIVDNLCGSGCVELLPLTDFAPQGPSLTPLATLTIGQKRRRIMALLQS